LRVVWLPTAIVNRDDQLDHIALDNPRAAIEQGDRIMDQVDNLFDHPEIGRVGRVFGTRELVINGTPFILVYRYKPQAQRVELIRLLHGSQQWPPL
jgi:toxin ParE1/3/4